MEITLLSPAQRPAAEGVLEGISTGNTVVLRGGPGSGKSTVLRFVRDQLNCHLLGMREFMQALDRQSAIEEAYLALMREAFAKHDLIILDDLHLITAVVEHFNYQRAGLLEAALTALMAEADAQHKKLIFSVEDDAPVAILHRAYCWRIESFTAVDYEFICRAYFDGAAAATLDYAQIHRFAPALNAHQLKNACVWVQKHDERGTDRFVEYLREQHLFSNVALEEVEHVEWTDLKGVDEVIQALEAKIALPFENEALAAELNLKPKRGVLLAGPPGTGKTTIGRALAHRLKSKFFLIDGTVVAGSEGFHREVNRIFDAARRNAPSIIFIDDADVIFGGDEERGLCRYLLTKMDGLESASSGRVCVMMTAMEPGDLPAALLRAGRVELWLEMRVPDDAARAAIVRGQLANLPGPFDSIDLDAVVEASEGLTGADLKAVIEDGKLLYAHDRAQEIPPRPIEDYFLDAIATVRKNRRTYTRRKPSPALVETMKIGFEID